jgi:hypothetical protein
MSQGSSKHSISNAMQNLFRPLPKSVEELHDNNKPSLSKLFDGKIAGGGELGFLHEPEPEEECKNMPNVKYVVVTSLTGSYIKLGDLLTCANNSTLIDTIKSRQNIVDENIIELNVGDIIQLTCEIDVSINTYFEIVSVGSNDSPWVVTRVL